ncbi:MAG: cytochrome c biogenesis protein CcdA [Dehalococcoidales bacterium]|nr:cytochrome c biogenesis protein CcdA [Dehalococcoidales bacterium]
MDGLLGNVVDIINSQSWLAFPASFLGGIVSSASPCVLAMIPLVIGYVGGYSEGSRKKAIQYSLVFTLGLTITFTALGVIAGAMGRLFGDVGSFWNYFLPSLVILLGLQLVGVFRFIKLNINVSQRFLPKRKALFGALLMGLLFGIIASPCATPVMAVILTFAAAKKEIVYSGGLLLAYALGHWVLVLGAGISVGFAQRVLESKGLSNFSSYARRVGGVILIGVGIYFFTYLF